MSETQGFIPEDAQSFLEQTDKAYGKNTIVQPTEVPKPKAESPVSLGQAVITEQPASTISGANDSFWKNIPITNLPSGGIFYPDDTEITVRAATVGEIRHWSTIDESDALDIDDKLNFILEKCLRIKTKNTAAWLSWRDICDIDRMYIIFAIHEQTFPNKENVLWSKFLCEACPTEEKYSTEVRTTSLLLQDYVMNEELQPYFKPEYKCYAVESAKLNETFYLYAPTLGVIERIRAKVTADRKKGKTIDKAFIKALPYIIQDWNSFDDNEYNKLKNESLAWHINKFSFIDRFANLFQQGKSLGVALDCPKCGSKMTAPLFLGSSFTIKSLFLISGRLDELV
jgi:hypothetical protein